MLPHEIDPRILGQRIAEARKARGKTQEEVAEFLACSRPTYIAIEKGDRGAKPDEIVRLASFLGRKVNELVRPSEPVTDLQPHLRAVADKMKSGDQNHGRLNVAIDQLQSLAEDYRELERMMNAPLRPCYPAEVVLNPKIDPVEQAEVVANQERNRLGLGDQPVISLRSTLEWDVGLRIFYATGPSLEYRGNVRLLGGTRGLHPDQSEASPGASACLDAPRVRPFSPEHGSLSAGNRLPVHDGPQARQ